jgi:hypothetical protein
MTHPTIEDTHKLRMLNVTHENGLENYAKHIANVARNKHENQATHNLIRKHIEKLKPKNTTETLGNNVYRQFRKLTVQNEQKGRHIHSLPGSTRSGNTGSERSMNLNGPLPGVHNPQSQEFLYPEQTRRSSAYSTVYSGASVSKTQQQRNVRSMFSGNVAGKRPVNQITSKNKTNNKNNNNKNEINHHLNSVSSIMKADMTKKNSNGKLSKDHLNGLLTITDTSKYTQAQRQRYNNLVQKWRGHFLAKGPVNSANSGKSASTTNQA